MKRLLAVLFWMMIKTVSSQGIGYEMRTNTNTYILFNYQSLEFRHKANNLENRISYRPTVKLGKHFKFAPGVHYKIEKHTPTLEPRMIYHLKKCDIWVQQEFWYHEWDNTCIAVDIPSGKVRYRVGWDTSKTIRVRVTVKI